MADKTSFPPLSERTKVLTVNILVFYVAFMAASGRLLPSGGLESVWLLSAITFWFLTLLTAPWFLPPRDGLAGAVSAMAILVTIELTGTRQFQGELNIIRWIAVAYCVMVSSLSLAALFLHDHDSRSPTSRLVFKLNGIFGKGEILFTPTALISILGAYQGSLPTMAWLVLLWTLFVVARPVELGFAAWRQWQVEHGSVVDESAAGVIDRIDHPNIIRVRLTRSGAWKTEDLYVAAMPDGGHRYVLPLFTQVQGTEVIGTGLCVASLHDPIPTTSGHVYLSHESEKAAEFLEAISGSKGAKLVGFTVENSTIGTLRFEVVAVSALEEGEMVFARISGHDVFYQILDAETAEESFDQNPRGTHIVRAAQLGCYDASRGFTKYPWLPAMNTPLFTAKSRAFDKPVISDREFIIGKVPSADVGVAANLDELVEYHTAILGVTGTGKTELALDIVREAHARGVKVFCVDFTGEYRQRLANLNPVFPAPSPQEAADLEAKLFDVETGEWGAKAEKKALKVGITALRASTTGQISTFLESGAENLAIFELGEITNTQATLRLTELYLSTIMTWARGHRRARQIMIVLEEAHTIIPETGGSGFGPETNSVVSRIGQIALQGRKYGVGLLVVTQRTALVSKTILSQCNTFLTHSLIDQTSLSFLENVYSSQHARLIPNLSNLQFLAFGKALRAERPVLLQRDFDPEKKKASEQLRRPLPVDVVVAAAERAVAKAAGDPKNE